MKVKTVDQLGRPIEFSFPPQRIISLVPSQTELLFDLGLGARVVGITRFCVHPEEWAKTKTKIGGTKKIQLDAIDALQPDLIIGNKEENDESSIRQLASRHPVWMSDVATWQSALAMIAAIGHLVGEADKAGQIAEEIARRFENINPFPSASTLYLIWRSPWMAAGRNTFIDTMLSKIGLDNCLSAERYPELSPEEIKEHSPELVLLSSEPFPFQQKHITELRHLLPAAKIILVDGEMFSWYGSRLLKAPRYYSGLQI